MKTILLAGAVLALLSGVASANPCTNVVGDCIANGGDIFKPVTTQNNNQTTTNNNHAYGGAGGSGGSGGAGGNAQEQQQQNQSQSQSQNATANNQGVSNAVNIDSAASSVVVSPSALSGLAASECVLSDTQSVGAGLQLMQIGIAGAEGTGHTKPYDECNTRAALPYVAAAQGTIQGVDTKVIYANMVSTLHGVQAAIDKAKGKTPETTSSTSATPAAIAPEQTASAKPASCIGASPHTNWYANNCAN